MSVKERKKKKTFLQRPSRKSGFPRPFLIQSLMQSKRIMKHGYSFCTNTSLLLAKAEKARTTRRRREIISELSSSLNVLLDEVFNLIWFSSELASGLSIKSGMWFVNVGFCFEQSVAIRTRCRWRLRLEDSSWRCLCNHYLLRPGQVRNINIIVSDGNSKSDHHWSVWKNCNDASIVHNFYST